MGRQELTFFLNVAVCLMAFAPDANAEYSDGMSQYRGYFVPNNWDPEGTITITTNTPPSVYNSTKCGDPVKVEFSLKLDNPAPCDGYIVQEIVGRCSFKDCPKNCNEKCPDNCYLCGGVVFYEAWFVRKGDDVTYDNPGSLNRPAVWDKVRQVSMKDKCGYSLSNGTAKFFCKETTGDLGKFDKAGLWKPRRKYGKKPCRFNPGGLVSTDVRPVWWGDAGIEPSATRSVVVDNSPCCKNDKPNVRVFPKGTRR